MVIPQSVLGWRAGVPDWGRITARLRTGAVIGRRKAGSGEGRHSAFVIRQSERQDGRLTAEAHTHREGTEMRKGEAGKRQSSEVNGRRMPSRTFGLLIASSKKRGRERHQAGGIEVSRSGTLGSYSLSRC